MCLLSPLSWIWTPKTLLLTSTWHIFAQFYYILCLSYLISCALSLYSNILDEWYFIKKYVFSEGDVFSNVLLMWFTRNNFKDENRKIKNVIEDSSPNLKIPKKKKLLKEKINYEHFIKILVECSFYFLFIYLFLFLQMVYLSILIFTGKNIYKNETLV